MVTRLSCNRPDQLGRPVTAGAGGLNGPRGVRALRAGLGQGRLMGFSKRRETARGLPRGGLPADPVRGLDRSKARFFSLRWLAIIGVVDARHNLGKRALSLGAK